MVTGGGFVVGFSWTGVLSNDSETWFVVASVDTTSAVVVDSKVDDSVVASTVVVSSVSIGFASLGSAAALVGSALEDSGSSSESS